MMRGLVAGLVLSSMVSCKQVDVVEMRNGEPVVRGRSGPVVERSRYAVARRELEVQSETFFRIFDEPLETKLDEINADGSITPILPLTGRSDRVPYSGFWYPWGSDRPPRALALYDEAFHGGERLASNFEATHHSARPGEDGFDWAGHCNGFAAASQRHPEPERTVRRTVVRGGRSYQIDFSPLDIKALLAEIYMSANWIRLAGQRCEVQGLTERRVPSPSGRHNLEFMGPCEDVNPGSFHVIVTNWIGRQKKVIIHDQSYNRQVWNYPLYGYEAQITQVDEDQAVRLVGASGTYPFNSGAEYFAYVEMATVYANAPGYEARSAQYRPEERTGRQSYRYILELDASRRIIGGEWVGASRGKHPDFLWVALSPIQQDPQSFDPRFGNPFVEVEQVLSLWKDSTSQAPDYLPETPDSGPWGEYPNFVVSIDGSATGAAFLGKPVRLIAKRRGQLTGEAAVTLFLNGYKAHETSLGAGQDLVWDFEPTTAVNRLGIEWKQGSFEEKRTLRFYGMP